MLERVYQLRSYISYWLKKEEGYSLQSPKLFAIYKGLKCYLKVHKEVDLDIEAYRNKLLNLSKTIEIQDLGAGSKRLKASVRKVSEITKYSTSARKYAQLYQFFCSQTPANQVIELGTCVGITSRYLSRITVGKMYTFEASASLVTIAKPKSNFKNLTIVEGDIHHTLPELLAELNHIDFVLIDATHTYDATISYFNNLVTRILPTSIIVIGDIHWSKDMNRAWEEIKVHQMVKLSLDYFECGIVYFDFPGPKSHYIMDL